MKYKKSIKEDFRSDIGSINVNCIHRHNSYGDWIYFKQPLNRKEEGIFHKKTKYANDYSLINNSLIVIEILSGN